MFYYSFKNDTSTCVKRTTSKSESSQIGNLNNNFKCFILIALLVYLYTTIVILLSVSIVLQEARNSMGQLRRIRK